MKSHTGGVISFGTGAIITKSAKQKLNTKSSTEAELVGASDCLPATIWTRMFLDAQGYTLMSNLFYQDNQSAMKLAMNGRASCGQKSRHIDIRFFFIKDRLQTEHIKMTHCPTEAMLADFFTKPLQGNLFVKFKRVLMGHAHIDILGASSSAPIKERVGNNIKNETPADKEIVIDAYEETPHAVEKNTNGTEGTEGSDIGWTVVAGKKIKRGTLKSGEKKESSSRSEKSYHSLELIQLEK
jgi:hypothetical protein